MLEVDAENGKVIRHFQAKPASGADEMLADGLRSVKRGEAERDEKFKAAREKERGKFDRMETLFREKKKEVEESGDKGKPLRPIDLD